MSVPAARIRTSGGWRDMAIRGAPGIPGYTPSARAHSGAYAIVADTNARFYTPALTIDVNDFSSNPFANAGRFTVPVTARYLIGCAITEMAAGNGSLGIILNSTTVLKRITHPLVVGADGTKPGIEIWDIYNLTAGHDLMQHSWSSGGGSTNILTWNAIRLDAPALNIVTNIPLVTSLPASPVDGQEVYYLADATNGIIWHLRYRAAASGSYKWEVLGGPPLRGFYATVENFPAAWASGSPAVPVPLAGEYDVEWQGDVNITGISQFYIAFYLDAVRNDAIVAAVFGTANPQEITYAARNRVTIAAGQTVRQGFIQTGAPQGTAKNRTLIVRPVRVG